MWAWHLKPGASASESVPSEGKGGQETNPGEIIPFKDCSRERTTERRIRRGGVWMGGS